MANRDPWYFSGPQQPTVAAALTVNGTIGAYIAEQLGTDPVIKLADAINNLADALRTRDASES